MSDKRLSVQEVAKRVGVSHRTIRRWIDTGRLPAYRVGPVLVRVDPDDVDRLIAGTPITPTAV